MKKAKAFLAIAMAATLSMGLVGCGGSADTSAPAASTPAENAGTEAAPAENSGTAPAETVTAGTMDLNVMLETPVESLDPQQATDGTSFEVIANFTDGLMQMDADGLYILESRDIKIF